jgi:hypothetical protein
MRPWVAIKLIASGVAICAGIPQIAFVLAFLVVDKDEHAAVARVLDDVFNAADRVGPVAFQPGSRLSWVIRDSL